MCARFVGRSCEFRDGASLEASGDQGGATRASLGLRRSNRGRPNMDARVQDRVVVESERAAQSGRAGVIEEVLAQDPPRFRVRWDDGRTSIFAPSAGVARIEPRRESACR